MNFWGGGIVRFWGSSKTIQGHRLEYHSAVDTGKVSGEKRLTFHLRITRVNQL